jgi:hypothetical protein
MQSAPALPPPAILVGPGTVDSTPPRVEGQLVLVDVEGANRDWPRRHPFEHPPIDFVLPVFVTDVADRTRQQELGAIEPDAFRARVAGGGEVVRELDVGLETDANSIGRRGRPPPLGVDADGRLAVVRVTGDTRQDLFGGINDHGVVVAVDDHELPRLNRLARIVQPDDRRHFERSRENRGVIRAAARIRGEAADLHPVHLRGERRRQLVGDQHGRFIELAQQIARRLESLPQVHAQPPDQVGDIAAALAQIGIGHLVKERTEFVEYLLHGPLGVHPLFADNLDRPRDHHRVVQHEELCVEQRRQVRPPLAGDAGADVRQLLPRAQAAALETRQLVFQPRRRHLITQRLCTLNQDHRAAGDHAWRDANAGQSPHWVSSPKPDATSAVSACTASSSSEPSALTVSVDPQAAASNRRPMMLLPSICRASRATSTLA